MNVQNCLHPRVIKNPFTGQETVIPCGRCSACLNNRALMLTTRCDMETSAHKYAVFGTLTYADNDVPQVVRLRAEDCERSSDIVYIDSDTGEFFDFNDKSIKRHRKSDVEYCYKTKVLPVLCKSDFQKFIKLVRYYANQIENGIKLRYVLTGEYGETTFRPHGHFILWFDSDAFAQRFKEVLCKSWSHGILYDPHIISGSASSYVTSYINGFVKLPAIYQHRKLRPFVLYSKFPALGMCAECVPDLREVLDGGIDKITFCPPSKSKFIELPFWRSLSDRFCPRIQRFNCIDVALRIELYRLVERYHFDNVHKFAEFLYYRYVRSCDGNRTEIGNYLYDICHSAVLRRKFSRDGKLYSFKEFDLKLCINSLVRFCTVLNKAKLCAQSLQLSIKDFVIKMSNYFDNIDQKKFTDYLKFQQEYFRTHPVSDYLLFDFSFVHRVNGKDFCALSASDQHYLRLCGVADDGTDVVHLSIEDCLDYHLFAAKNNLLADQLTKKKVQFDYLLSQGENYDNIKNYFDDYE